MFESKLIRLSYFPQFVKFPASLEAGTEYRFNTIFLVKKLGLQLVITKTIPYINTLCGAGRFYDTTMTYAWCDNHMELCVGFLMTVDKAISYV